jgi:hypothetical protein
MKARRLIDGASFGPETIKAMGQAFDQAWAEIAGSFGTTPAEIEKREAAARGGDAVGRDRGQQGRCRSKGWGPRGDGHGGFPMGRSAQC